jgi:hypothetical protein
VSVKGRLGWTSRVSNSGGGGTVKFSPPASPDRLCDPSSLLFSRYWRPFPGVKRPGRKVGH